MHKHSLSPHLPTILLSPGSCSILSLNQIKRSERWSGQCEKAEPLQHTCGIYAGHMQLMRYFWNAAVALDPAACTLDEGQRFPLCQPEPLRQLFQTAQLRKVEVRSIDVPTTFRNFDDYWSPFLGGQGPAPGYAMSLSEERR